MKKNIITYLVVSVLYIQSIVKTMAQNETVNKLFGQGNQSILGDNSNGTIADIIDGSGVSGKTDAMSIIMNIARWLFSFLGLIAVVIAIKAGFEVLISGKEDKKADAMKTLLNAVIGIVVIVFAYTIVNYVISGIINTAENGAN